MKDPIIGQRVKLTAVGHRQRQSGRPSNGVVIAVGQSRGGGRMYYVKVDGNKTAVNYPATWWEPDDR